MMACLWVTAAAFGCVKTGVNRCCWGLLAVSIATLSCSDAKRPPEKRSVLENPEYSAGTIVPNGSREPAALAPGVIASIYGRRLGPDQPCHGNADPAKRETPSILRPVQTIVETQVFPQRLCGVEVRVGNALAGLMYVSESQINFKLPQHVPASGVVAVQVSYREGIGPAVTLPLRATPGTSPSDQLAATMWSALQAVRWDSAYRAAKACSIVPPAPASGQSPLQGYSHYCAVEKAGTIAESFYFPVDGEPPAIVLRRADFRLANSYPEMSVEVEQILTERLTRAYGKPASPELVYEIGAGGGRTPGKTWQAGDVTLFLHQNRNHAAPAGVREGVLLVAVQNELLRQRERSFAVKEALGTPPVLASELGPIYLPPSKYPTTEEGRQKAANDTFRSLQAVLRQSKQGDPARGAALLFAADDLTVRLGGLLVKKEAEAPESDRIRRQLAASGIRYTGMGHYSGMLEYDRGLLRRAAKEFPETPWGQRAFLQLQRLSCALPDYGCDGLNCFLAVIERGEKALLQHQNSEFQAQQTYHLALANETWWSLSQAGPEDSTAEGAKVTKATGERARKTAIQLYEKLIQLAPESPESEAGRLALPRLKLALDTGQRTFFCFSC